MREQSSLGSARASRAVDRALAIDNMNASINGSGEAPKPAREARALPRIDP